MSEMQTEQQPKQKTMLAFVAGLLVGGLLVWVFTASDTENTELPEETEQTEVEEVEVVDNSDDLEEVVADDPVAQITPPPQEDVEDVTVAVDNDGVGSISVSNQAAGSVVMLDDVVYPFSEGWVGVRDYLENGELGYVLGAARFSTEQGLLPQEVALLRATTAGETYAVVFYTDNGDRKFNLDDDTMIESPVASFTAGN